MTRPPIPARALALAALALSLAPAVTAGCEGKTPTDFEEGWRELRELDAYNRATEPPISYWDARGCSICPNYCRFLRIERLPPDELRAHYLEYAVRAGYRLPGRWKGKHTGWEVVRIGCSVKLTGGETEAAFLGYLHHDLPVVRALTAGLALEFHIGERATALEVLTDETYTTDEPRVACLGWKILTMDHFIETGRRVGELGPPPVRMPETCRCALPLPRFTEDGREEPVEPSDRPPPPGCPPRISTRGD